MGLALITLSFPSNVALSVIAGIIIFYLVFFVRWSYKLPLPPKSPMSIFHNFKKQIDPNGLVRQEDILKQSLDMSKYVPQLTFGSVYRSSQPLTFKTFIFIADYQLARLVLLGDSKMNVKEGIKRNTFSSFNFFDRNISNIFT
jgi:hypothetical protein